MNTKSKLLAMTADLQANPRSTGQGADVQSDPSGLGTMFPPVAPRAAARTGPGQMLQFRGQMLAHESELRGLKDQLQQHDGALPTRKLDADSIVPSRWANRHPASFSSPDFARLREDIAAAGGNVQPILVRPAQEAGKYEMVFGHRRRQACMELGLPVLATIDAGVDSDLRLFAAMDRENRERADLSPYEQGAMYRHALNENLYPSNRRLAEALGVSHTWVANVLAVADLPPPVIECFRSPLEIQPKHARAISAAYEVDRKALLRRAEKLRQAQTKQGANAVVDALTKQSGSIRVPQEIFVSGRRVGSWQRDGARRLVLEMKLANVPDALVENLLAAVSDALEKQLESVNG